MDNKQQERIGPHGAGATWRTVVFLVGITLFSFALRSHRMYPEFNSSDMVGAASFILDGIPDEINPRMFVQHEMAAVGNPLRNFLYHYSPLAAILGFLNVVLISSIGVPITEYVWVLPMILIGAVTPLGVYGLVKKVADHKSAIVAALVIALFPIHVIQSRALGPAYALGFFTQLLVIYTLLNYMETGKRRDALRFGACLGLAIYADFLWIGLIPVILYTTYVNSHEEYGFWKRALVTLRKLFRPNVFIVPLVAFLALIIASITFQAGPLWHLMDTRYSSLGLYIDYFYRTLMSNSGYVLGAVMTLSFFAGIRELVKLSQVSIFFLWGLIYTVPFWFSKYGASVVSYGNYGLQAFAIFSSILLVRFLARRGALTFAGYVTIAFLLLSSFYVVVCKTYGYNSLTFLGLTKWLESYTEPSGIKAAGYWLRKNTNENDRVFAFAYGGTGMEPYNALYYFNRTIIGKFDSPNFEDMYSLLQRFKDDTDYLVIAKRDYQQIREFVNASFFLAAEIRKESDGPFLLIFAKEKMGVVDVLNMQESYSKFDEEFGNLKSLSGEVKFGQSHPNPYAKYYWEGFNYLR